MNSAPPPLRSLSTGQKVVYAMANVGLQMLVAAAGFFLMIFYTDVALVPPAVAGTALLVGKIWDVVNDPLFGWISDRTRSRFGRRRVYLAFGAAPLFVATVFLWALPPGLDPFWAFIWIAVSYTLFDTLFTLIQLPYAALSAELTRDYDERTQLVAYASVGALIGHVLGSVLMPKLVASAGSAQFGYLIAGGVFGLFAGGIVGFVAWRLREPPLPETTAEAGPPLLASMRQTLTNRPFLLLLAAFSSARLGMTLLQTTIAYFAIYQIQVGKEGVPKLMGVLLLTVAVFIVFWKKVCDRWSKHTAYAAGLAVCAVGALCLYPLQPGQLALTYGLIVLIGFGLAAHWVAPFAMLPDVTDLGADGQPLASTGIYFGVYGLFDKAMRAIGSVAVGWVLQAFHYVPNTTQSEHALFGIKLLMGPLPAVCLLLAIPFLLAYPVDREHHRALATGTGSRAGGPAGN